MSVENKHPEYTSARVDEWRLCADAYNGESAIKARGETYLPMPSGYRGHADGGLAAYDAYRKRAQFADIMAPSIGAMIGIIHAKEIVPEIPNALDYLHENINGKGRTLVDFHKEITRCMMIWGRYGVLADAPSGGGDVFLAGYNAPTIINWDDDFFVLDESDQVRDGFIWSLVNKFRTISISDGQYSQKMHRDGNVTDITPTGLGGGTLDFLPFVVGSAKQMGPDIDTPPLIGVARAALAMYQLSADYRLQLFMSGQETLVSINGPAPSAVGAGVVHEMSGADGITPDLKYVSPACTGIDKHLEAIEHNRDAAVQSGARLFEQDKQAQESGEARKMRFRSETANLQSIAQMSCSLLEAGLRNAARMMGQDSDGIVVSPPDDLMDATLSPQDALTLYALVEKGALSYETFYDRVQKGGIASPERTADEEYAETQRIFDSDGI